MDTMRSAVNVICNKSSKATEVLKIKNKEGVWCDKEKSMAVLNFNSQNYPCYF